MSFTSTCSALTLSILLVGLAAAADLAPEERLILEAFDRELAAHEVAARGARAAPDPARMVKAARDRRVVMRRLVREDPQQALALALDRGRRQAVPAAARAELEQEVTGMGALEVVITRPLDDSQAPRVQRRAVIDGQRYQVTTWNAGLSGGSETRRSLHGVVVDGVLALSPARLRVLEAGEAAWPGKRLDDQRCPVSGRVAGADQEPEDGLADVVAESGDAVHVLCQGGHLGSLEDAITAAEIGSTKLSSAWTMGAKKVLYVIARCADEAGFPQTVSSANSSMAAVDQYYRTTSWNKTSMSWEVIQVVLPRTRSQYDVNDGDMTLLADARAAAAAMDSRYALANWHFDLVRHSSIYGWAGQGFVGGKGTWLQSDSPGVAIHELGHNYGLWHANFWNTGDASSIGAGANSEYGDPFSEMGGGGQFTAYEKWRLDWIPAANIQTISGSGTYRVHASDTATAPTGTAMHGLRIVKDSQRDYWISHRRSGATNQWALNGVFLHWDPWAIAGVGDSNYGGQLLDATPGSTRGKTDAALVRGRTFSDTASDIHITPMTLDAGTNPVSMNVVVNIGPFPGNRRPLVSLSASSTSVATGANVTFTATASDPDGDALAVYWDFADDTFASNVLTTTRSWSTAKDYPVRVRVSDMKGGTASATVVVRVGSVSTFRISGTVTGPGGAGVEGVRIHRGTTASSVWTNSDGSYTLANLGSGDHTVQAQLEGYAFTANFTNPVNIGSAHVTGKNFSHGNAAPTVRTAAAAAPTTVTGTTTALSVLGADDGGEAALTYLWATTGTPPAPVSFSVNGTNAAKSTTATFGRAGTYQFRATIRDQAGATVASTVTVTVAQTATTVAVSPATPVVHVGATQGFTATLRDQFAIAMGTQPAFAWSVSGGKVISSSGVVAASSAAGGPYTVTATGAGRSGSTTFTVVNDAPTISAIANRSVVAGASTGPIPFTIGDTETAAGSLTVTRASSNTALIPLANVVLGGSGTARTVTITSAGTATGTSTITIAVSDGSRSATRSFVVTVTPSNLFQAKINFQPLSAWVPEGYVADGGLVYGSRGDGLTFGWNVDVTATTRDRNHPDSPYQMRDTLVHLQKPETPGARWEIAVPNGAYEVDLVAGDPAYFDSIFRIAVEGVLVIDGRPISEVRWLTGSARVQVNDGRLTITSATGADNNKLNAISITAVPTSGG
jgi:hypothetical protein